MTSRIPVPTSPAAAHQIAFPTSSSTTTTTNSSMASSRNSPVPGIKRVDSAYASSNLSTGSGYQELTATRQKQNKRDEAIRKRLESELARKRPTPTNKHRSTGTSSRSGPRPKQGTVSALRPLAALTVPHNISVSDASQLCAAKRTDCVLVVDEEEHLCGIFTAKDLAFRVVGDGLDPRTTPVSSIMTPNPMVTRDTTSATEALHTMVTRGFRHLPVCNEDGDVVGLLDITKVFNESLEKLEKAYGSSQKLYTALEGAQEQFGATPDSNPLLAYVQALRDRMSFPDLGSILDARTTAATVTVKTSVRDAARLMRERRTTAVCVMEGDDKSGKKISGIFTSKDVVLRVIAAGLDAKTCSVVRVMTPHPDTAKPSLSIQDALRKMHTGHYLNLPVVDDDGALIGIVDVLKLTYATLEQVNSIGADPSDQSGGPVWGRFFNAVGAGDDDDSESIVSGAGGGGRAPSDLLSTPSRHRPTPSLDTPASEVYPGDSASVVYEEREHAGASSIGAAGSKALREAIDVDDGTYLFKFVAPGGTTHRFQARYDSHDFICDIVRGKLSSDPFFAELGSDGTLLEVGEFQMSYFDDDGDLVLMTADRDVLDAVSTARKQGKDRVVLHLRGGKGWEDEAQKRGLGGAKGEGERKQREALLRVEEEVVDVTPAVEDIVGNEAAASLDEKDGKRRSASSKRKSPEQKADELVLGFLQKDQLLPASIAVLAAAIVGVFTVSKFTSK